MKFLTGAPTALSLSWIQEELLNELLPQFSRFMSGESSKKPDPDVSLLSWPSWRTITTVHLLNSRPTMIEDNERENLYNDVLSRDPRNLTGAEGHHSLTRYGDNEDLEQPFVVHEFCQASQVTPVSQCHTDLSLFNRSNYDSFAECEGIDHSAMSNAALLEMQTFPTRELLTDLCALPNANYLRRISPGTITVDILVGILDISPPRRVAVRRQGSSYEMDIVEVYVRDETQAGLKISIWLKPEARTGSIYSSVGLRPLIARLRKGDIVFFKHIALRSYRGEVCGQSLSSERYPDIGTKLALLSRREGLNWGAVARDSLENLSTIHAAKLDRVQSWVAQFLGMSSARADNGRSKPKKVFENEELPDDTQD